MSNLGSRAKKTLRVFASTLLAALLVFSTAAFAWAQPESDSTLSAGNVVGASEDGSATYPTKKVDRDFCWAGRNVDVEAFKVGGDVLVAGMNLDITDTESGGSVRVAGMNISLTRVSAKNNFTIAGQNIDLNDCDAQGGVYCAGERIAFTGTASGATFAGANVCLDGTINGDVNVYAGQLELGPNAKVTGKLYVEAGSEPAFLSTAEVSDYEYKYVEESANTDAAAALGAAAIGFTIASSVIGFIGTIVFAIVLAWLFRRPVEKAAAMTRVHAGRIFATGAITAVAAPVLFVMLLCFVVTMPIAFALLFSLIVLTIAAVPFAAASFARLVFPKMNRIGAAAIGGAVLGIASILPFLGMIVSLAAFIYTVGYVIQALWEARRPLPTPPATVEEPIAPAPVQSIS